MFAANARALERLSAVKAQLNVHLESYSSMVLAECEYYADSAVVRHTTPNRQFSPVVSKASKVVMQLTDHSHPFSYRWNSPSLFISCLDGFSRITSRPCLLPPFPSRSQIRPESGGTKASASASYSEPCCKSVTCCSNIHNYMLMLLS